MFNGIIIGLFGAIIQCITYLFSRQFVLKHGRPLDLMILSQVLMGVFALIALPFFLPYGSINFNLNLLFSFMMWIGGLMIGQFGFFQSVRLIEASRLSSLLGLKLAVVALIFVVVRNTNLNPLQWISVLICVISAVGMNWSGGNISLQGWSCLGLTLLAYSICDFGTKGIINSVSSDSLMLRSGIAVVISYSLLGILTVPMLYFVNKEKDKMLLAIDALPFAFSWFFAMFLIYASYAALDVIFANIVQSLRGLFSVVLGAFLVSIGFNKLEPQVSRKAWIRRFISALIMIAGIIFYSLAS